MRRGGSGRRRGGEREWERRRGDRREGRKEDRGERRWEKGGSGGGRDKTEEEDGNEKEEEEADSLIVRPALGVTVQLKIPALPPRPPLRLALTSKVVTHAPMFFLPRSLILGMSGLSAVATVTVPDVALLNCSRKLLTALVLSASWVPVVSVPQCLVVIARQLLAALPLTLFNSVIVNDDNIEHKPFFF